MNPVTLGAALSGVGVILGAFGAHALRGKIGYDLFDIYQTSNQYLLLHSFALIFYGLWHRSLAEAVRPKTWPAKLFLIGILIFSGSLYTITFTVIRKFGMITPLGGLCLIAGWFGFAYQAHHTAQIKGKS